MSKINMGKIKEGRTRRARRMAPIALALGMSVAPSAHAVGLLALLLQVIGPSTVMSLVEGSSESKRPTTAPIGSLTAGGRILWLDEVLANAFPDMSQEKMSDLKIEIERAITDGGKTTEERAHMAEEVLEKARQIADQRRRIGNMGVFERQARAEEMGASCSTMGMEGRNQIWQSLREGLSPWPKNFTEQWKQSCWKSLNEDQRSEMVAHFSGKKSEGKDTKKR